MLTVTTAPGLMGAQKTIAGDSVTFGLTVKVVSAAPPHAPVAGACFQFEWWKSIDSQGVWLACEGEFGDLDAAPGSIRAEFTIPSGLVNWSIECFREPNGYVWQDPPSLCGGRVVGMIPHDVTITERVIKPALINK